MRVSYNAKEKENHVCVMCCSLNTQATELSGHHHGKGESCSYALGLNQPLLLGPATLGAPQWDHYLVFHQQTGAQTGVTQQGCTAWSCALGKFGKVTRDLVSQ